MGSIAVVSSSKAYIANISYHLLDQKLTGTATYEGPYSRVDDSSLQNLSSWSSVVIIAPNRREEAEEQKGLTTELGCERLFGKDILTLKLSLYD